MHRLGIGNRRQCHRLFVVRAIGGEKITIGGEGLANAGDVAMAKDRPDAAEQGQAAAIAIGVLRGEIAHQSLRHGQPDSGHCILPSIGGYSPTT